MLIDCPLIDQLDEGTLDGNPDENARANCVPASLSSAVRGLLPGAAVDGDTLKDAVYGQGYVGATDPARYVAYLQSKYGVTMTEAQSSDGHALVAMIMAGLQRHEPVTGAIPSQWGTPPPDPLHPVGGTHEVVWCDYSPSAGTLTAMNPWPVNGSSAFYQTEPLNWWAARIVYGRVFTLSGGQMSITIADVAAYYHEIDPQHWVSVKGSFPVQMGILAAYQSWPSNGSLAGLTALGLPLSGPQYQDQGKYPGVALQCFERGCLVFDPNRVFDSPPGAVGPVYLAHYPAAPADPLAVHAEAQVAAIAAILAH